MIRPGGGDMKTKPNIIIVGAIIFVLMWGGLSVLPPLGTFGLALLGLSSAAIAYAAAYAIARRRGRP